MLPAEEQKTPSGPGGQSSPYIGARVERRRRLSEAPPRFVLAYDASCEPCSRFKEALDFLDPRGRISFVSLTEADRSGLLTGMPQPARFASFHLLRSTGGGAGSLESWSGAEALFPLIRLLSPFGAAFSRFLEAAPGGRAAATFAYSRISKLHRSCPVDTGRTVSATRRVQSGIPSS